MDNMKVIFDDYIIYRDGHIENMITESTLNTFVHNCNGYKYLTVHISGKYKRLSRLVAEAFVYNPENKPLVTYKDGNSMNCSADNLEWVTFSEKRYKEYKNGRKCHTHQKEMTDAAIAVTSVPVYCIETSTVFPSMHAAALHYDVPYHRVKRSVRFGIAVPDNGYHFKEVEK